jgi:predicted Zn-ribbon and HTH transcriptional regulator
VATRINLDNGAQIVAHNRCSECEYEWLDKPMGLARYLVCPRCSSEYWEWINYEHADAVPSA